MKKIDILSPSTNFFYKGRTTYSSALGGCFTLLTALVFCGFYIFFGWDLFVRESPEVSFSVANNDSPSMGKDKFFATMSMMYPGGFPIAELERKLKFQYHIIETDVNDPSGEITKFRLGDMVPCDNTLYFKENRGNIKSANLAPSDAYYCLPDEIDYEVHGQFGSSKFSMIGYYVSYCSGRSDCYSRDFISKNLTDLYMQATFKDYYVDSFDFGEPVKDNLSQILNKVSIDFMQVFHVNFQELYFNDEQGWFFSQNSEIKGHVYESYDYSIDTLTENSHIIELATAFNKFKQQYNRKYIKFQDVLAQVAGVTKVVMVVMKGIVTFISDFSLNMERMSNLRMTKQAATKQKINNFTGNSLGMSQNKIIAPNKAKITEKTSIFSIFTMRKQTNKFSKTFKNILSEQNLFELCVLHEISKKKREDCLKIEENIAEHVKTKNKL